MSDLVFRTTSTDRTVIEALIEAAAHARHEPRRRGGSGHRRAEIPPPAARRLDARPQADAARRGGQARRRDAAQRQRRGGHIVRPDVGRPRAGDDQFHRRRRQYPRRLQGGADRHHRDLARLHRARQARTRSSRRSRRTSSFVYLEDVRATIGILDKLRGMLRSKRPLVPRKPDDCGRHPLHLGLGGRAEGRRALPPQHAGQLPRRPRRASTSAAPTRCSTCCRCSTPSG